MKRSITFFTLGFILGMLICGILVWQLMPGMMINVHQSNRSFDKTVELLEKKITEKEGWKVPAVFDIQQSVLGAGYDNMIQVKIVTLCQPHYVKRILTDDNDMKVSTMMPLGIGVYETNDGKVYISDMNINLMGKMFGGTIAEVMGEASADINQILDEME